MNDDDKIMKAFKTIQRSGATEISANTITLFTQMPKNRVYNRLKQLAKYRMIRKKGRRTMDMWELV
jgi:RIO-like serine/threonine protein kinase